MTSLYLWHYCIKIGTSEWRMKIALNYLCLFSFSSFASLVRLQLMVMKTMKELLFPSARFTCVLLDTQKNGLLFHFPFQQLLQTLVSMLKIQVVRERLSESIILKVAKAHMPPVIICKVSFSSALVPVVLLPLLTFWIQDFLFLITVRLSEVFHLESWLAGKIMLAVAVVHGRTLRLHPIAVVFIFLMTRASFGTFPIRVKWKSFPLAFLGKVKGFFLFQAPWGICLWCSYSFPSMSYKRGFFLVKKKMLVLANISAALHPFYNQNNSELWF